MRSTTSLHLASTNSQEELASRQAGGHLHLAKKIFKSTKSLTPLEMHEMNKLNTVFINSRNGKVPFISLLVLSNLLLCAICITFLFKEKKDPKETYVTRKPAVTKHTNTEVDKVGVPEKTAAIRLNEAMNSIVSLDGDVSGGSGFLFRNSETIVTNFHVVDGNTSLTAKFNDGSEIPVAGVLVLDEKHDLAVLKLEEEADAKPIKLSRQEVAPGQRVYAIGAPKGLDFSITEGVLSGTRTWKEILESFPLLSLSNHSKKSQWIQFSAPISPGNSGGPLISESGTVVGVCTLSASGARTQNLNFAIHANHIAGLDSQQNEVIQTLASLKKPETEENKSTENPGTFENYFLSVLSYWRDLESEGQLEDELSSGGMKIRCLMPGLHSIHSSNGVETPSIVTQKNPTVVGTFINEDFVGFWSDDGLFETLDDGDYDRSWVEWNRDEQPFLHVERRITFGEGKVIDEESCYELTVFGNGSRKDFHDGRAITFRLSADGMKALRENMIEQSIISDKYFFELLLKILPGEYSVSDFEQKIFIKDLSNMELIATPAMVYTRDLSSSTIDCTWILKKQTTEVKSG